MKKNVAKYFYILFFVYLASCEKINEQKELSRLERIKEYKEFVDNYNKEKKWKTEEYFKLSEELRKFRKERAGILESTIDEQFKDLNMENAKLMVAFLVFHLSRQKVEWAVCTGTVAVRYVLQQMRLHFHVIDKADPNALGAAQKQWGNYYQQKPLVLAINVAEALAVTQEIYDFNF